MPDFTPLASALPALGLSAWLTRRLCDPVSRFHLLDHPNERSLHTRPTPRSGGLGVLTGWVAGSAVVGFTLGGLPILLWLCVALLPLAVVSFMDDYAGVSAALRFVVHTGCAVLLVWGAGLMLDRDLVPGLSQLRYKSVGELLALLYIIWMVNLYNFMDGMDGLAGGMAVIGFGTFAVLGFMAGHGLFLAASLVAAAAAGGFLLFNFPPARIFMGDVGSSSLGFLAAALTLWAARDGIFPFWLGLLVFSPFIVDATITLVRRLLRGERVWQAHKTHYYQRLVHLGWGHKKTVLWEYALMLACGLSAIGAVRRSALLQWMTIVFWLACYIALALSVHRLERRARMLLSHG